MSRNRNRSWPSAPEQQVTHIKNAELYVHKDYGGLLCYYATGLQEGGPHACFNMLDILWARQVRFHIERMRNL